MLNVFGKLNEARQKMEEIKQRLDSIIVEGSDQQGKVKAEATGSRKIKSITADPEWLKTENPAIINQAITDAVNEALRNAEKMAETEMQHVAKDMLPGMGGLGNLFGK